MNKYVKHPEDTYDQIQMCLSCKRPRCVNCIGSRSEYHDRYLGKARIVKNKRLNDTARNVIYLYRTASGDKEIAEALNKKVSSIANIRKKLGLPSIRSTTSEERNIIVDDWIREGA